MTRLGLSRLAAGAAGLVFLLPPAPASADDWLPLSCATGAITQYDVAAGDLLGEVSIEGWIQPCDEAIDSNGFAVGRYRSNRTALYYAVQPYASLAAPTTYTASTYFAVGHGTSGITAICLLNEPGSRVACVGLDVPDPDGPPIVTPISIQDPRVRFRAEPAPVDDRTPGCASCL